MSTSTSLSDIMLLDTDEDTVNAVSEKSEKIYCNLNKSVIETKEDEKDVLNILRADISSDNLIINYDGNTNTIEVPSNKRKEIGSSPIMSYSLNKEENDFITCCSNKSVSDNSALNKRKKNDSPPKKPIVTNTEKKPAIMCDKSQQTIFSVFFPKHLSDSHCVRTGSDLSVIMPDPALCSLREITGENLNLKYGRIFSRRTADDVFKLLEEQVQYFSGDLLKVKVFGKWHDIPRKQACYGDQGLSYTFSGNCFPAQSWSDCPVLCSVKNIVEILCQHNFNFVLVNRYKDGKDHMGEHRDDEKELEPSAPIASVSFGQHRDFIFKHKDARGRDRKRNIPPVTVELEHGSLLIMESPTNQYWYHSLPVRSNAKSVRINLTFRFMKKK